MVASLQNNQGKKRGCSRFIAGWVEVNTDRLAQIEAKATRLRGKAEMLGRRDKHAEDVLALVEIAKAAREAKHELGHVAQTPAEAAAAALSILRSALARLDSGAAEGDA